MTLSPEIEQALARKRRNLAVVIAAALCLWLGAQWVSAKLGHTPIFSTMVNGITLVAFFWCMIVSYQIWRIRREHYRENLRAEGKPHA
jgi:type VI protein secretion system component VasK